MINPYAVAGFLAAVFPLIATPGASLTLLIQHAGSRGRRQAVPVVLGTITGLYVHAGLAIAGLSALVMHSSQAFAAVRLVGAAYLIGLGLWTWRSAGGRRAAAHSPGAGPVPARPRFPKGSDSVYVQALLANVLNPKAASIYLTLVPQFIAPDRSFSGQILLLATAHALLIALWLGGWTLVIDRAARALRRPRLKATVGRVAGGVLLCLGVRTAAA